MQVGAKYAIATSSCTGATTWFGSLGIGAIDEVVLADLNWIATALDLNANATPVLAILKCDLGV